ncbi:MAG: Rieske (2Fe-2S) protein [Planctomycetes bacterium]|nr:Rieske (2Fe-2S) protein [Planctomycetota bacterium]
MSDQEPAQPWHDALPLADLPDDGGGTTVTLGGEPVALFLHEGRVVAVEDTCPHAGASLGCGVLTRGEVTCPWHGWHFDARTGASTDGLDDCLRVHAARVSAEGRIEVRLAPARAAQPETGER